MKVLAVTASIAVAAGVLVAGPITASSSSPEPQDVVDLNALQAPELSTSTTVGTSIPLADTPTSPAPTTVPPVATTTPPAPTTLPPVTTTIPPAPTTVPPTCTEQAVAFLTGILAPHGIATPAVVLDASMGHKATYSLSGTITIRECTSDSVLAHEAGHYVHHLASGDWGTMAFDSGVFCLGLSPDTGRCEEGWLSDGGKSSEAKVAPGVEHAAHCIGYALGVSGSYTKCPHQHLVAEAVARIGSAG